MKRTLLLLLVIAAGRLEAHHRLSETYQESREVTIAGQVTQWVYREPHSFVLVEIRNGNHTEQWIVEGPGARAWSRTGVDPQVLRIGDRVTVTGYPGRVPAERRLLLRTIVRPLDGVEVGRQIVRVLVVEDEQKVATALRAGLESERYDVVVEGSGEGAFFRASTEAFDVILLDLGLPGRDGLQILQSLRARDVRTPVLILTARDTAQDRVIGLDSGADDYLVKPFAFAELLARVRALLRRGRTTEPMRLKVADLEIDLVSRKVTRGGQAIDLTVLEFQLLHCLVKRQGESVSRDTLAHDVWKETAQSSTLNNVIDVHIARLRRKIDLDRPIRLIHTIRGVGFMLREGEP